jgi:hypothetical protein
MSKQNASGMAAQPIRVPPMKPQRITFWFSVLERQLAAAGIERNDDKATFLLRCLEPEYQERVEDAGLDLSIGCQYDQINEMLIRSVAESDSERVKRLVENEVMGDRKTSQFYQDLKKLASPFASEQFILTLWKNRLPDRIQRVLAVIDDTKPAKIIQAADRVEEACSGSVRSESCTAAVSKTEVQDTESPGSTNNIEKQLKLLQARIDALDISVRRRTRSRSPGRRRRRSRSRNGLCYYHDLYRERARKRRSPCRWNQGNGSSRP